MSYESENQIEVIDKTVVLEFLQSLRNNVQEVSNLYYEENINQGNLKIISIIDDLSIILSGATTLFSGMLDVEKVNSILEELVSSMESGDNILTGDLLSYEIEPMICKILESLKV